MSGYMNKDLWRKTMDIFIKEAENRQGLGHSDQALLYLDGCSSHDKDDTIAQLKEYNIISIFFPSNTSHIVQPCDDKVFAGFKVAARGVFNRTASRCTITEDDPNKYALYDCLTAYLKAVTKSVIIASFRDRGICPFSRPKILANALDLDPTSNLFSVDENLQTQIFPPPIIHIINAISKTPVDVDRRQSPELNNPVLIQNTQNWKDGRSNRSKNTDEIEPISMDIEKLQDLEEDKIFESDNDDPKFGKVTSFKPASKCDHCNRQPKGNGAKRACFDCNKYHLCTHCYNTTDALAEHVKTHPDNNKRRTRTRERTELLTLSSSSDK